MMENKFRLGFLLVLVALALASVMPLAEMSSASVPDSAYSAPMIAGQNSEISVQFIDEQIPWGIERIDARAAQSQTKGRGVKIAIFDTGIDLNHPDLRVAGDVSFVPGASSGDDDNGHGTLVAGIIAALDNDIGVVGVAPRQNSIR